MARNTKNVLKNITILFLLTAVVFLGYSLNQRAKSDVYTANSLHSLEKKVLSTTPKVEKLRDTFRMIMLKTKHDTIPNPPLTIHDTVDIHNRLELFKKVLLNYNRIIKDSLSAMSREKNTMTEKVSELSAQNKKLSNQPVIHIDGLQSRIDSNADIVVLPFKKSARKNFLSPQKNYWRVYNKTPGGTINTHPGLIMKKPTTRLTSCFSRPGQLIISIPIHFRMAREWS